MAIMTAAAKVETRGQAAQGADIAKDSPMDQWAAMVETPIRPVTQLTVGLTANRCVNSKPRKHLRARRL